VVQAYHPHLQHGLLFEWIAGLVRECSITKASSGMAVVRIVSVVAAGLGLVSIRVSHRITHALFCSYLARISFSDSYPLYACSFTSGIQKMGGLFFSFELLIFSFHKQQYLGLQKN